MFYNYKKVEANQYHLKHYLWFIVIILNQRKMLKNFTISDKLLFVAALLSLLYSESLYFQNQVYEAIFIGIWVPSILAFGIYLKIINNSKNG